MIQCSLNLPGLLLVSTGLGAAIIGSLLLDVAMLLDLLLIAEAVGLSADHTVDVEAVSKPPILSQTLTSQGIGFTNMHVSS